MQIVWFDFVEFQPTDPVLPWNEIRIRSEDNERKCRVAQAAVPVPA